MRITVDITPVPLARPRINTTNRGRYLPKRSRIFRENLQWILKAAMAGKNLYEGAVTLKINLYKNIIPTAKGYGDADNHAKAVLDAANGILFTDDSQIVNLQVIKHKSKIEGLTLDIDYAPEEEIVGDWRVAV